MFASFKTKSLCQDPLQRAGDDVVNKIKPISNMLTNCSFANDTSRFFMVLFYWVDGFTNCLGSIFPLPVTWEKPWSSDTVTSLLSFGWSLVELRRYVELLLVFSSRSARFRMSWPMAALRHRTVLEEWPTFTPQMVQMKVNIHGAYGY